MSLPTAAKIVQTVQSVPGSPTASSSPQEPSSGGINTIILKDSISFSFAQLPLPRLAEKVFLE